MLDYINYCNCTSSSESSCDIGKNENNINSNRKIYQNFANKFDENLTHNCLVFEGTQPNTQNIW